MIFCMADLIPVIDVPARAPAFFRRVYHTLLSAGYRQATRRKKNAPAKKITRAWDRFTFSRLRK
ncbi:MAG: hypothetical protein CVU58_06910 [Deltaproteobacteria bacterium HGW-Deltaproteobacteria-16]|nr:MAG: hypothetical protein CVU58_06910 [Deltaproteobacteria bacterium HGW-Deltaproteobacteria-16]